MMEVKSVDADHLFRLFTTCKDDPVALIVDIRPNKEYKRDHVLHSYNVRLTSDGKHLADQSRNDYKTKWSQDCWWGKEVVVYGDAGLKKDHPVVEFLAKQARCSSLAVCKPGLAAFKQQYPFLVTAAVKLNTAKMHYPSQIIAGLLYLGDWNHAERADQLADLHVGAVLTIHNSPQNLRIPQGTKHLAIELADVESSPIEQHFSGSIAFVDAARAAGTAVLVHCGAGVSRSATLCCAFLMHAKRWNADKALQHCKSRRSLVSPNGGFRAALYRYEEVLGITPRSQLLQEAAQAEQGPAKAAPTSAAETRPPKVKVVVSSSMPAARSPAVRSASAGAVCSSKQPWQNEGDGRRRLDSSGRQSCEARQRDEEDRDRSPRKHRKGREEDDRDRSPRKHRNRREKDDRDRPARKHRKGREEDDRDRSPRKHRNPREEDDRDRPPRKRQRGRDEEEEQDRSLRKRHAGDESSHRRKDRNGQNYAQQQHSDRDNSRAPQKGDAHIRKDEAGGPGGRSGAAPEAAVVEPAVVMEVRKEGRVVGQVCIASLSPAQQCVFGRVPTCDVKLEHQSVSRQHAQLAVDAFGALTMTDLGSAHGTNIDGVWVRSNQPRKLAVGSVITFGASTRSYTVTRIALS